MFATRIAEYAHVVDKFLAAYVRHVSCNHAIPTYVVGTCHAWTLHSAPCLHGHDVSTIGRRGSGETSMDLYYTSDVYEASRQYSVDEGVDLAWESIMTPCACTSWHHE